MATAAPSRSPVSALTQGLAYTALRSALTIPAIAGLGPSREAARSIGRTFGGSSINKKRVRRAIERLEVALPAMSVHDADAEARHELVLRSYEHLAMLAVEVAALPRLITPDAWFNHVEVGPMRDCLSGMLNDRPTILITGHCGNWEIVGASIACIGCPMHALYRPLDLKPLDNWVRRTRASRGITLVDKFGAAQELPPLFDAGGTVGFVADQNAGDKGLFVPFMGRLASAYKTIGLLAVQHEATIVCGQARRLGWDDQGERGQSRRVGGDSLRFRIDIEDTITPEDYRDVEDPVYYITARYRRAIERLVARAPEQYLWMHRIWKSRPRHERADKPFPKPLLQKLRSLPWLSDAGVDALVDRSDRDRAFLKENNIQRLP